MASLVASLVLLFFYPIIFDRTWFTLCEWPDTYEADTRQSPIVISANGGASYFKWRLRLDRGDSVAVGKDSQADYELKINKRNIPWWFPDTQGDELEQTNGWAMSCSPPLGVENYKARPNATFLSSQIFRLRSLVGVKIDSKTRGRKVFDWIPANGIVKATLDYSGVQNSYVFLHAPENREIELENVGLKQEGLPFISVENETYGTLQIIESLNQEKIYSFLHFFEIDRRGFSLHSTGKVVDYKYGERELGSIVSLVLGPRIFSLSPWEPFREAAAILYRAMGFTGYSFLPLFLKFPFANFPNWYLLPLPDYWAPSFFYYHLVKILLFSSVSILVLIFFRVQQAGWRGNLIFVLTILLGFLGIVSDFFLNFPLA